MVDDEWICKGVLKPYPRLMGEHEAPLDDDSQVVYNYYSRHQSHVKVNCY